MPTSPANDGFNPGFANTLMNKDLGLAMDAVASTGSAAPLRSHAAEIYTKFAAGNADRGGTSELLTGGGSSLAIIRISSRCRCSAMRCRIPREYWLIARSMRSRTHVDEPRRRC